MALRSLVQLRGLFELIPGGSKSINPSDLQNNDPPSVETQLVLTTGLNTVNIPTKAYGAIIIFDPTSTVVKTILGAAADIGILTDPASWNVLTFPTTPPTNFLISAAGNDGLYTSIIFF